MFALKWLLKSLLTWLSFLTADSATWFNVLSERKADEHGVGIIAKFYWLNSTEKEIFEKLNAQMKEVTVQELKEMMDSGADFQLIDIREPHEYDYCNINGELIPQGDIPDNIDKINRNKKVILQCRSGSRSANMVQWLEKTHGFSNLYNLKGGILAWAREIDPSVPTY